MKIFEYLKEDQFIQIKWNSKKLNIMKKLPILMLFFAISCQPTFILKENANSPLSFTTITKSNQNEFVIGAKNTSELVISKFNSEGETEWVRSIDSGLFGRIDQTIQVNNKIYIFCTQLLERTISLLVVSQEGILENDYHFNSSEFLIPTNISEIIYFNNKLYGVGTFLESYGLLFCLNLDGTMNWTKRLGQGNVGIKQVDLTKFNNNLILLSNWSNQTSFVSKLNIDGEIISSKYFFGPNLYSVTKVSDYLFIAGNSEVNPTKPILIKLDDNLELEFSKIVDNQSGTSYSHCTVNNGIHKTIVLFAVAGTNNTGQPVFINLSANGEINYSKIYSTEANHQIFNDDIELFSNGYTFLCGQATGQLEANSILRTNSSGSVNCSNSIQLTSSELVLDFGELDLNYINLFQFDNKSNGIVELNKSEIQVIKECEGGFYPYWILLL